MEEKSAPTDKSKKSSNKILIIVLLAIGFFAFLCMCCIAVIAIADSGSSKSNSDDLDYSSDESSDNTQDQEADDTNSGEESGNKGQGDKQGTSMTAYVGNDVMANLPAGWTIKEYYDGTGGYGLLMDGSSYTGLTAVVLRTPTGADAFSMVGADGIGGPEYCSTIYRFTDTPASYVNSKKQEYLSVTGNNASVVDLGSSYIEFVLLGKTGRILGSNIYWDNDTTTTAFEPRCAGPAGLEVNAWSYTYNYPGNSANHLYLLEKGNGLNVVNAQTVADILGSIQVVANP